MSLCLPQEACSCEAIPFYYGALLGPVMPIRLILTSPKIARARQFLRVFYFPHPKGVSFINVLQQGNKCPRSETSLVQSPSHYSLVALTGFPRDSSPGLCASHKLWSRLYVWLPHREFVYARNSATPWHRAILLVPT